MPKPATVDLLLADVALGKRKDSEVALEILGELVKSEQTSSPRRYFAGVWAIGILSHMQAPFGKTPLDPQVLRRIEAAVGNPPLLHESDLAKAVEDMAELGGFFKEVASDVRQADLVATPSTWFDVVQAVRNLIADAKGRAQVEADSQAANAEVDRELATLRATVKTQADRIACLENQDGDRRALLGQRLGLVTEDRSWKNIGDKIFALARASRPEPPVTSTVSGETPGASEPSPGVATLKAPAPVAGGRPAAKVDPWTLAITPERALEIGRFWLTSDVMTSDEVAQKAGCTRNEAASARLLFGSNAKALKAMNQTDRERALAGYLENWKKRAEVTNANS